MKQLSDEQAKELAEMANEMVNLVMKIGAALEEYRNGVPNGTGWQFRHECLMLHLYRDSITASALLRGAARGNVDKRFFDIYLANCKKMGLEKWRIEQMKADASGGESLH
jgi:hypothetical protein